MALAIPNMKSVASGLSKVAGVVALSAALLAQSTCLVTAAERASAFIIDANNGKVLFSKDADERRYPASLTKMMTLYMLFEALESGRTSLSSKMSVSAYAASRPPSKLGLKPGSTITVEEGILGLVTKSANDAAVVISEHLAGSEDRFAQAMTAKARKLGMSRTTFRNANGLPNDGQMTTARDMATLGIALREHFPTEYAYFKTKSFNFRGRAIGNHNRLLGRVKGVDGIKTGYINASGFNLVSSVAIDGKKVVGVVFGGTSGASRDNQMAKLLNQYLPQASTRGGGELVARADGREGRIHVAAVQPEDAATYAPPSRVPLPAFSKRVSVNERIAEAYGSDAGGAIARITGTAEHPIVGRAALRAALNTRRPEQDSLEIPTANSLAPLRAKPSRMVPPAAIPRGADLDPATTGSVDTSNSPWIVQIAATPDHAQALAMLAEAKSKAGSALGGAAPFTQAVASGSQTLYRARFAGFQSKNEANAACAALKKRSYSCYAVAN